MKGKAAKAISLVVKKLLGEKRKERRKGKKEYISEGKMGVFFWGFFRALPSAASEKCV